MSNSPDQDDPIRRAAREDFRRSLRISTVSPDDLDPSASLTDDVKLFHPLSPTYAEMFAAYCVRIGIAVPEGIAKVCQEMGAPDANVKEEIEKWNALIGQRGRIDPGENPDLVGERVYTIGFEFLRSRPEEFGIQQSFFKLLETSVEALTARLKIGDFQLPFEIPQGL